MEFKKFMFLVTQELKRKGITTTEVTSPYSAPPLIAKAWDLVILYTKHYEEFSKLLLGTEENGWIDKPPQNQSFARYKELRARLVENKALLCPWWTLWPDY